MRKSVSCRMPFRTSGALVSSDGQGWTHRIFAMAVAVLVAVTLGSPAFAWAVGNSTPSNNDQGVATDNLTGTLTIAHTNDIHGYYTYDARNGSMGFAYFRALLNQEDPDLVLDAGDTFHGQSFATVTEGKSIAQLMSSIQFDATTPGNHDWSYGAQALQGLDDGQSFSILAANVIDNTSGQPAFDDYITKDVEISLSDGSTKTLTVGVLGVIDESFYTSTPAQNVEGLTFVDPVQRANEVAKDMRDNGCDVVIALTHNEDPQGFAQQTKGIDAVIAGHEHILIDENVTNAEGDTVPVVEAGHYFQYAGVLDLTLSYTAAGQADQRGESANNANADTKADVNGDTSTNAHADGDIDGNLSSEQNNPNSSGEPQGSASDSSQGDLPDEITAVASNVSSGSLSGAAQNDVADTEEWDVIGHSETAFSSVDAAANLVADDAINSEIAALEQNNETILGEVVGTSKNNYPYAASSTQAPGGWELVRTEDTPIGHVVTASYLAKTGADLAFENAGGIRGGISAGEVTAGDLLSISPYGNTIATYELTGQQVKDTLEHSLEIMAQCRAVLAKQSEAIENGEDPLQYSWPDNSGRVIVAGGATMTIDWNQPEGERIRSITIDGQALGMQRMYTVAMNSYLPGLGSEYSAFNAMTLQQEWGTCEQALRSFVGTGDWEARIYELSGTVTYAEDEMDDNSSGVTVPVGDSAGTSSPSSMSYLPETSDSVPVATALVLGCVSVVAATTAFVSRRQMRKES